MLNEARGIQTTSITVHEEGKTDRGALKVGSPETLDDGRFRIIYRGDFRDDSFADVVCGWLKMHGQKSRAQVRRVSFQYVLKADAGRDLLAAVRALSEHSTFFHSAGD